MTTEKKKRVIKTHAQNVWDYLADYDVSKHTATLPKTNKRPAVDYLPWHRAWMIVKREFPGTTYEHKMDLVHKADSVEVEVTVTIPNKTGTKFVTSTARLAVMDARFNAILMPDASQIMASRQRCLVKALAYAGLGLNLWAGDALPVGKLDDPINGKQAQVINDLIFKAGIDESLFLEWIGAETVETIAREDYEKAQTQLELNIQKKSKR